MKTPILETVRMILRPISVEEAEVVFNGWTSDEEVARFMRWSIHTSVNETRAWLEYENENISDDNYNWGFELKSMSQLIGSGGLTYSREHQCYELGCNFMKNHWGNGYATEVTKEILEFAKNVLKVSKVFCCHALENTVSEKIVKKLGFIEGEREFCVKIDGSNRFTLKTYFLNF